MPAQPVIAHTGHAKATVNGTVVAETDKWEFTDGNVYFPPGSVKTEFFSSTKHSTHCPWKGDASYYTIKVDGQEIENGAWYYPEVFGTATALKDHVAFYKDKVDITVD